MLDAQDIKLIGEEMGKVIEQNVTPQFEEINQRLDRLEGRTNKIEATMVTKDYLDEKLGDLRGDIIVLMRKEDTKLRTLIDIMRSKQMLTDEDVKKLFTMEPFPQLM